MLEVEIVKLGRHYGRRGTIIRFVPEGVAVQIEGEPLPRVFQLSDLRGLEEPPLPIVEVP